MELSKDQIIIIQYWGKFIVNIIDVDLKLINTPFSSREIIKVDKDHIYWKATNGLLEQYSVNQAPVFKNNRKLESWQVNKILGIETIDVFVSPFKLKHQIAKSKIEPLLTDFHFEKEEDDLGIWFKLVKN